MSLGEGGACVLPWVTTLSDEPSSYYLLTPSFPFLVYTFNTEGPIMALDKQYEHSLGLNGQHFTACNMTCGGENLRVAKCQAEILFSW